MNIIRERDNTSIKTLEINFESKSCIYSFAGFKYSLWAPLLYYCGNVANFLRTNYFGFDLDYSNNNYFFQLDETKKEQYLDADIEQIKYFINNKEYNKRIFIGKSLGTSCINRLIDKNVLGKNDSIILITPGTEWNNIIHNLYSITNQALIIGSLDDPCFTAYDYSRLKSQKNIKIIEFNKLNHALETGNIKKDLKVLYKVIKIIHKFIKENV